MNDDDGSQLRELFGAGGLFKAKPSDFMPKTCASKPAMTLDAARELYRNAVRREKKAAYDLAEAIRAHKEAEEAADQACDTLLDIAASDLA